MNQDEIIAMAKEAGFGMQMALLDHPYCQADAQRLYQQLERFAALVAAKERERVIATIKFHPSASHVSPDFRDLFNKTVDQQAASTDFAIRARGTKEGV